MFSLQGANLREPLIVKKIRQMDVIGVRSTAEARHHLDKFLKTELFCWEEHPPESSRRYYTTDVDMRNILHASSLGDRRPRRDPDDQSNLEIKLNVQNGKNQIQMILSFIG